MGFEISLINFHDGEPSPFPFSLVQKSFGPYCDDQTGDCWVLQYPDGARCELSVDPNGEPMDDLCVWRPPRHPEFWQGLFDLMQVTTSCLYWPGGGPVIVNPSAREHLHKGIIECLGEAILVERPEQILEEIEKS